MGWTLPIIIEKMKSRLWHKKKVNSQRLSKYIYDLLYRYVIHCSFTACSFFLGSIQMRLDFNR